MVKRKNPNDDAVLAASNILLNFHRKMLKMDKKIEASLDEIENTKNEKDKIRAIKTVRATVISM